MKRMTVVAALAASAMLAMPVASADTASKGQAKLAKILEDRVAGEPQSCVQTFPNTHMRIIDETAIVIDRGSTIYVNVPRDPDALDDGDALKIRKTSNSLCRTDIVTTFDRSGGFYTGNIFLGDFVPYKKIEN